MQKDTFGGLVILFILLIQILLILILRMQPTTMTTTTTTTTTTTDKPPSGSPGPGRGGAAAGEDLGVRVSSRFRAEPGFPLGKTEKFGNPEIRTPEGATSLRGTPFRG